MKVKITENEKKVLRTVVLVPSGFNFDELDFTKEWKEQKLENDDCWQTFYDYEDYPKLHCFTKRALSGIISSLNKKKLITSFIEKRDRWEGPDLNWLMVYEENFNNLEDNLEEHVND